MNVFGRFTRNKIVPVVSFENIANSIVAISGYVTPTEIMPAQHYRPNSLFFPPTTVCGNLGGSNASSGVFPSVRFLLTDGFDYNNVVKTSTSRFVFAANDSRICTKFVISAGSFEQTPACQAAK